MDYRKNIFSSIFFYLESEESVNLFDEDTYYTNSEEENESGGEIEDDNYDAEDDIYEEETDRNNNNDDINANIDVISKEAKTVDDTAQEMDAIYKAKIMKFKQMLAGRQKNFVPFSLKMSSLSF